MRLHKFGDFYIDLDAILWVRKITAELLPANVVRQENVGGVRIGIGNNLPDEAPPMASLAMHHH